MAADAILVVDAGTSALRTVLVELDGSARTLASIPWPMFTPDDAAPYGREYDSATVGDALATALEAAAPVRNRIAAIAFTGQREGLAFSSKLDAVCISPNVDARASAEGIAIDARMGDVVYAATGHQPSLMQAPAKWRWLQTHRPDSAGSVTAVLPLADWLASGLARELRMSRSLAIENGLAPLVGVLPADPYADVVACAPEAVVDGSVVGSVQSGVFASVPVVLAGADTQCALVGMGVVPVGEVGVPAGWSAPLQIVLDTPLLDRERRTWTGVHVVPERYVLESNAGETGRAWAWIREMMGLTDAEADALVAASPVGSNDVMAVIGPRVMRAHAMSAGVGALTMPLPFVMAAPSRGDVLRSVLEATAHAIRANLEQLEALSGRAVPILTVGGGMSRGPLPGILAQVLGRPVEVARSPETSAVGAAVLASVAVGLHASLEEAVAAMTGGRLRKPHDASVSAEYDDLYDRWCAMADTFESGTM